MHEDKLYIITSKCTELNHTTGCADASRCAVCQFNIFNYVTDVREAALLKATAHSDYQDRKAVTEAIDSTFTALGLVPLITILIIIGMSVWCCSTIQSCLTPAPTQVLELEENDFVTYGYRFFMDQIEKWREPLSFDEEIKWLYENQNNIANVPRILRVMRMHELKDINGDGKIDCIDYSIMFHLLYGSDAHIIINRNPHTKMNHMFIRIWYGPERIMDIEPQGSMDKYTMGEWWGDKYNHYYNRDVTTKYGGIGWK